MKERRTTATRYTLRRFMTTRKKPLYEPSAQEARASWERKFPALEAAFRKRGFEHFPNVVMDSGRAEHAFSTGSVAVLFHIFAGGGHFFRQCRELLIIRNELLQNEQDATVLSALYVGRTRAGLRAPNGIRLVAEPDLSDIWDFIGKNGKGRK